MWVGAGGNWMLTTRVCQALLWMLTVLAFFQVADKRAQMRQMVMQENQNLAQEQKSTQAFLETQIYPNAVDDKFFSQFNTTSR